ncbi:MAG TPA: spermidine/putrescine ABC transporter substrate-binding protein [Thermomicrobiales bacterium]|nr:spermidine/putrescine ABC transporter substrate-binding protein [Thermomicrobiales bacterium]
MGKKDMQPKGLNRRSLIKGAAGAAAGGSALSTAIAQASTGNPGFNINLRQDNGELVIYNWYQPWIAEVVPIFEEEAGINVTQLGTYSSNDEWWARLNAGENFDFFIPSTDWVQRAMAANLLHPLDEGQIPNIDNLYEEFQENEIYQQDGNTYAVPFSRVYYSLTYNTEEFPEAPTSWGVTWDAQYDGRITMQDQAYARVGTTALYIGDDPIQPTEWDRIRELLLEQKELVFKYWTDYQNGMEMFINEEALVGQLTAGRTRMGAAEGAPIDWTVPEEGVLTFIDTFAIPSTSENPENGHKFINFLHRADIMAMEMRMMYYDTLNRAAREELEPELAEQFAVPEESILVLTTDLDPQVRQRIDELWTEVKLS